MCTPASAFTVVALRALPLPRVPSPVEPAPDPVRRRGPGLMLAAIAAWFAAGRDGARP